MKAKTIYKTLIHVIAAGAKTHTKLLGLFLLIVITALLIRNGDGEIIEITALNNVFLFDPDTLSGNGYGSPKVVGILSPGSTIYVSGCKPRKTDIDLEVKFDGKTAVMGSPTGTYSVTRRLAPMSEKHAIASCRGLMCGIGGCS